MLPVLQPQQGREAPTFTHSSRQAVMQGRQLRSVLDTQSFSPPGKAADTMHLESTHLFSPIKQASRHLWVRMSFAPFPPQLHQGSFTMLLSQRAIQPTPISNRTSGNRSETTTQGRTTGAQAAWVAWLNPYSEMQQEAAATAGTELLLRGTGCHQQQTPRS